MWPCHVLLPQCSAHADWPRQLSPKTLCTLCIEQKAMGLQAQPAMDELPSWAQTNFSLPMASEAARSRHALLPTMSSARRVTPSGTASMGPLYPSFDSSPIAPIDYGPAHAAQHQAPPPPPSAPPMPQHVRPPCVFSTPCTLLDILLVPQSWQLAIAFTVCTPPHELGTRGAVVVLALRKSQQTSLHWLKCCQFCCLHLICFQSPQFWIHEAFLPLQMMLSCGINHSPGAIIQWLLSSCELWCRHTPSSMHNSQHPCWMLMRHRSPSSTLRTFSSSCSPARSWSSSLAHRKCRSAAAAFDSIARLEDTCH